MRKDKFIGKKIFKDRINKYAHDYFQDDYDIPYYKIYLQTDLNSSERCQYSINIFVNDGSTIQNIEKDKDIFLTNYIVKRMPNSLEYEAESILNEIASVT